MDEDTFKLLTSFIIKSRKIVGSIDSVKLVNDANYAAEICQKAEQLGDNELVMLSLTLRQKLGLFGNKETQEAVVKNHEILEPNSKSEISNDAKYKLGARG